MKYLIDTNVCVCLLRKQFNYNEILQLIAKNDCYISEITLFELKAGEALAKTKRNKYKDQGLKYLINLFRVIPISDVIDGAAVEKARLQMNGTPLDDDFDLLIGCTSVKNEMVMVTENTKHFKNINNIKLQNWIKR